ncbi:3-oxoacyl-[acyl-carrier-protein] synthase III C-terminal domain-containing protein [Spirillospora sp. NBC_01491]|uniref:3-oxoacyl-[acyl-carrier-protein] synthase III C-terminal domain-containing protein n=1 Tax=Spirillospora sp. NBC_01491 TaxID=2976007 RepID=UPI002E2EF51B|nr:3-oxoacyl-[acyl-carrier-protein] synthase III C-terminal domain-containing protein [Spirillospora sp. NBC_01491]
MPDPERIGRWGYRTFHRAADGVTAVDLAAAAARDALDRDGLAVSDVDLLVLAHSEMPDYPHWDSSTALARALKMRDTQTLLLNEGCASGVTGLALVAGVLATQPEIQTVLFTAVNRVSEFHRNRMTVNNAVHSDGAVAAVLRRGHERNRWLATEQLIDSDLCDWFRTDYGGAVEPVPPEGWSAATAPPGHERVQAHFQKDPQRLREFGGQAIDRSIAVIDGACHRAGVSRDEVTHYIYINDPDGIADVAPLLNLPLSRTNQEIARRHGHMGAADQLTALGELLEAGAVEPGDLVALTGISIGMRWYCSLVRA